MTETKIEDMNFEAALAELERIVEKLDAQDASLDASIALYERGAALRAHCEKKLADAEERVAQITKGADGTATGATPVDPG